jgi:hypothetical protein
LSKNWKKNVFVFMHTVKSLKKIHIVFSYNKENPKNVLACILALITSLLKSWELGQYFKKSNKNILFCFVLVSGITNFYVKCITDIKKVVLLLMLGELGFTR